MRLQPLPVARAANVTLGVCVTVFGVLLVLDAVPAAARLAGVFVAVMGAVLVVRGWRVAVLCEQGEVTVRGLRWRWPRPLPGWTPIVAFMRRPGALTGVQQHNDEQLRRLERWAEMATIPRPPAGLQMRMAAEGMTARRLPCWKWPVDHL